MWHKDAIITADWKSHIHAPSVSNDSASNSNSSLPIVDMMKSNTKRNSSSPEQI